MKRALNLFLQIMPKAMELAVPYLIKAGLVALVTLGSMKIKEKIESEKESDK